MNEVLAARAPAKVNLTLHVLGRRADGYHELDSLVAFAGTGDRLTLTAGPALTLSVEGPTAGAAGEGPDNLVLTAARNLAARVEGLRVGAFTLTKRLPVAAGLGGGSSDAAAALRLLAQLNGLEPNHPSMMDAAQATGADVPVCLAPSARKMAGAGERLGPALALPTLFAVLVNPGIPVATRAVFEKLALAGGALLEGAAHPPIAARMARGELVAMLASARNDLEPAAVALSPVIGEALALLRAAPGCRLARMSGSGATVFGLFDDCHAAAAAARALRRERPGWWIKPTRLR